MGNICNSYCHEGIQTHKFSLRNSYSIYDLEIDQVMINNTALNLVSQDVYKYLKRQRMDSILCIQDSHLEFPDKTFKNYVGESVVRECKEYIKLHEDLILNKVMHTKGGKANTNYVIHGGYMKDTNEDNDAENLRRLITETLQYANNVLQCKSILIPLSQIKTYTTKQCASVILACQYFIIENQNNMLTNICFVGNDEMSIRLYRSALNANQKTELYQTRSQSNRSILKHYLSPPTLVQEQQEQQQQQQQQLRPERTSSKKLVDLSNSNQNIPQNKNISINKSQIRTSSTNSEIKDPTPSACIYKSGIRLSKSKNNLDDAISSQFQQEDVRTHADLEQSDIVRERRSSSSRQHSNYNITKFQQSSSYEATKDLTGERNKTATKKELIHYTNAFEQQINFDEQLQLQKSLKQKKSENKRNMKTEFLQTNITQGREDDETSEKKNSVNQEFNDGFDDSFNSGLESEQITSLLNPNRQQFQQDSLFYNVKLIQKPDSSENQNMFINSNYHSSRMASSHQNIYSNI